MSLLVHIRKKLNTGMLDVNFENEEGILAILGEEKSGKTEVLYCIAGLETPDEGRIVLNGRVLYDSLKKINVPAEQRKVSCLFRGFSLFPSMTVEENIQIALRSGLQREAKENKKKNNQSREEKPKVTAKDRKLAVLEKTSDLLKEYGLDGIGGCYPNELSASQKLWASFARALAAKPELLLMDEPFADLDPFLRADMLQKIRGKINQNQVGSIFNSSSANSSCGLSEFFVKEAVFASRDSEEVYAMSSHIMVMNHFVSEPPKERVNFFSFPSTVSAALLSGCRNITRAVRLDDSHAYAPSWGALFYFEQKDLTDEKDNTELQNAVDTAANQKKGSHLLEKLPLHLSYLGIRETDFVLSIPKEDDANYFRFTVHICEIDETLSDWQIHFRNGTMSKDDLLWQIPKSQITKQELEQVHHLFVPMKKIMKLT